VRAILIVVTGFALLTGCSDPKLTAVPASGTILAFGDSLTVGIGAAESQSYPSVLAELSGRRVINSGVSGETTAGGLQRLPGALAKTQPDLMILLEGGNDVLRNQPFASIKNNLAGMIRHANQQGVPVVLIGVPEKSLFSSSAPFYRELADEYEVVFDGVLLGSLLRTVSYKSDPIHLNEKGYRALAEEIHGLLVDNGAL
jgi:acyl-CoA thioesterase I